MNKRVMQAFFAVVLALLCACAFVACDFGGGSQPDKKEQEKSAKTEEKVQLETAMDNYKKEDAKKSTMKSELSFSMYLSLDTEVREQSFSVTADIDRVTDGEKTYAHGQAYPTKVSDEIKGLVGEVLKAASQTSGVGEKLSGLGLNVQQYTEVVPYLELLQAFLLNKMDLIASMGVSGSTINLKTHYAKKEVNRAPEVKEAWYYASGRSLSAFLGIDVETDAAVQLLSTPVMGKATYSKGLDAADKHVTKNGVANYDITFEQTAFKTDVVGYITDTLESMGAIKNDAQKTAMAAAANKIATWFRPDKYNFKAQVGTDKLPVETIATLGVIIDIPRGGDNGLIAVLNELEGAEILSKQAANAIATVVQVLNKKYLRNDRNEENHLGFKISLKNTETFKYDSESCDMTKLDQDLFIQENVHADGRVEVTEALGIVIEDGARATVESVIEEIVASMEDVDLESIVAEILAKLNFDERVTIRMVKNAVLATFREHEISIKGEGEVVIDENAGNGEEGEGGSSDESGAE